jgi:hypothetical protein
MFGIHYFMQDQFTCVCAYIHCVHELFVGRTASRVASGTKRLTHDEMTHTPQPEAISHWRRERGLGQVFCEVEGGGGGEGPLPKRVFNAAWPPQGAVKHRELAPARPA